jgi:hypothetical protein
MTMIKIPSSQIGSQATSLKNAIKENVRAVDQSTLDAHVQKIKDFEHQLEKIVKQFTLYKDTISWLSSSSNEMDPRITSIMGKVEGLKSKNDIDQEVLLGKIDKYRNKPGQIYKDFKEANDATKKGLFGIRHSLVALESSALSNLEKSYLPQPKEEKVEKVPTSLDSTGGPLNLNESTLETLGGTFGGLTNATITVEENLLANLQVARAVAIEEKRFANSDSAKAVLLDSQPPVFLESQPLANSDLAKAVAIEENPVANSEVNELKPSTLSKESVQFLYKEGVLGPKKSIPEQDSDMINQMPNILSCLQSLIAQFSSATEKLSLDDIFKPFEKYHAPIVISGDYPLCLLKPISLLKSSDIFLKDRFLTHFKRLCLQANLSEESAGAGEQLRAAQRLKVEFLFVYLYNFVRIGQLEHVRPIIKALEEMKLDVRDLPAGVKNPAHDLFGKTYKDYSKEWSEDKQWIHPHHSLFNSNFGREAFEGDSHKKVDIEFKRKMINQFLEAFCIAWAPIETGKS